MTCHRLESIFERYTLVGLMASQVEGFPKIDNSVDLEESGDGFSFLILLFGKDGLIQS
jgi:hypothetical protein